MKQSPIICLFILLFFLYGIVLAGNSTEVKLSDGSVISGEIVSFSNGVYTIRSGVLGTIKINESKIELISLKSSGTTAGEAENSSNASAKATVQSLQQSMMFDQQIMELILSLQNDPDIQKILKDPAILDAVNSGDIATLISNPKFTKIMQHPTIQKIQKEVSK